MADRILVSLCCFLCAAAFFLLGYLCRVSSSPVPFWAGGEKKLKEAVKDVPGYNRKMGTAFRWYGAVWCLWGILGAFYPIAGTIGILLSCTLGLFLLYQRYRGIMFECA